MNKTGCGEEHTKMIRRFLFVDERVPRSARDLEVITWDESECIIKEND